MTSEEDPAILALLEYLNGCEAAIASAKRIIIEAKIGNSDEPSWNPSKIKWEQAEGASGPYERSEDINANDRLQGYSR
jgi:hypothetical protein